jgi:hypothetical protein
MNEQQTNESTATQGSQGTQGTAHERCLCYELLDLFRARVGVSPAVRRHLRNSRVEFLKAIRTVIDDRIEHLSNTGQQGTKISVE